MSMIFQQSDGLSPQEKRVLLGQILQEKANKFKSSFPLSHGQQSLWFLYKLAPHNWAYNTLFTVRIRSEVDKCALRRAFQLLIKRHPSLRTTYTEHNGIPLQQIHENVEVDFEEIDASTWNLDELKKRVAEAACRPFNLEQEPVLRVRFFTRSLEDHVLMLAIHHIASDFWSQLVLMDELRVLYSAEKTGTPVSLPPQSHSYTDYVRWQNEMLAGSIGEQLWSYWQKQLAGELPVLNLPTDRPRPAVQTYRGASISFKLTKNLTQRLKELAQAEKVTLYMILLAAFEVVLYRYTGQEDILVGSPTFGRSQREFIRTVGYFVNPVVLRADFSGHPTFKAFLAQVRHSVLAAIAHQDYPFSLLVKQLQPDRDSSRTPLFQVMFVLQKLQQFEEAVNLLTPSAEEVQVDWGGLKLEPFEVPQEEGQFDLTLEMVEVGESLTGVFKYNLDLFDASTIRCIVGHFQTLLEGIVANPEKQVSELPLLPEVERQKLLVEWNSTGIDYPQQLCIHQLFEAQVEQTPDAVAVVFANQLLTYSQLNSRANKLAHYLRSLGVGPDGIVGLCVETSVEMVVGMLGVLKAGGAFLPLDPAYPPERLAFMLADAQVPVLLTQQRLVGTLPKHQAQIVCLDTDWQTISHCNHSNLITDVTAENLAYVIYTSGSTGNPKGVLVEHRSLVNYTFAIIQAFELQASERMPQLASLSFDVTLEELLPIWLTGATVVLPDNRWLGGVADIQQLIQTQQLTTLEVTTAYWHEWVYELSATQKRPPDCLRFVIMGGEKVLSERFATWQQFGISLVHVYGLTETTITSLVYKQPPSIQQQQSLQLPLGRPIANTQVYVLDDHLQPVPIGVPGELYIGGAGLVRGYLQRPDLTAYRFIPNPFSAQAGARLYKTGDKACYLADGNVEFLGRLDEQVKVRGFRVEVGEIEAVLAQYPQVRDNVVIVREDVPGDKRLVAYLVTDQQSPPSTSQLRQFLQQQLPEYMVPSAFVFLEALPLTPNGKVDRKALPIPNSTRPELETAYIAPHTPTEIMLAGLYAQVLGVEQVGRYNNFFDLGGHSLLGTQLISRVSQAFQVELPLRYLFEKPTVASLAERIEAALLAEPSLQVPSIVPVARDKELSLSFAQQRLWFMNQLQPNIPFYNVPAKLHISGTLNIAALKQSFNEIVQRHEVLRTTFLTVQQRPVQEIAPRLSLALPVVDLQSLPEPQQQAEILRLSIEEAKQPFKLDLDSLLRTKLLQLSSQEYAFLLTMHHIVSDAWSIEILVRELSKLYQAFCDNNASPLPPLPIQYADFAVWQRQWLQGKVLENQLHYWKQQLDGALPLLELPSDRPRPATQTYQGATQSFVLPADLFKALQQLSRRENVTLFMAVLAAFKVLLHRYTGEEDIIVGSPIAARNRREIEELIGFFINTLVLRTNLSGNPSFRELLGRVREVTLGAYAHQDLPFEKLVEELQPERDLSYSPLFQVLFDFQNTPRPSLELPNLTIDLLEVDIGTVRCDLELHCQENSKGFEGILVYNTDLFDAATITRMVEHLQMLLEDIVTHPDKSISDLSLLSAKQQQQLLVEWNNTQTQYPEDKCIHQVFETQAQKTPDAVAVIFEQQQLSYGELNARANQLAHHLQTLGVGPEVLVGLCVERSLEMVIGLLGILKAGGAYVPLDPTYPQERLAFMLEDSQVPILLTQQQLVEELPTYWTQTICLDSDWESIEHNSQDNPIHEVEPENLAYIIYTSGSTGKPKGVQLQHQGLCNLSKAQIQSFNVGSNSYVLQFASLSFDASVSEIVMTVCCGAKLCLGKADTLLPGRGLMELLHQQAITHMTLPPSVLVTLPIEELQTLGRTIIVAGEACSFDLAQRVAKSNRLFNAYGPTEATVCATIAEGIGCNQKLTIGRAIANAQVYILDNHLQPVVIGVPGELYIGGDGLARGYLNQPQLTAEKFIPNPFSQQVGARLYKTGDKARYLADGNIEFLGRLDEQVKIRGFRIELGEIEAVLAQHPHIQQAVVIVREDQPGDKRLVAYLIIDQENTLSTTELRHFLTQKLPEYMVPSAFVLLNALPLTSSRKIDRNALPAPDLSRSSLDIGFVAPSTPTEQVLATIWAEVLGLKQISIHDNFFELGGHSLLATQVISQIRKYLLIEIPLRSLFEQPTITRLSEYINTVRSEHQSQSLPPIRPVPRNADLPLSFAQQRLWFLDQLEAGSASYNIPATLRLDGLLDVPAFEMALQEIVWRHEALRTTFPMVDGAPVQVIASEPALLFSLVDLQELSEEQQLVDVQHLATKEAQQPFDLANGPLLRVTLLCLSPEAHVLLLTMHHIVSDAWSTGVFIRELTTLYTSCCQRKASPLPELPIQYADFAVWQRQWLQGEMLQTQLNYWKQKLAGAPPVLELPTDRPRPAVQNYQGATQSLVLPPDLSEALKVLSQRENATLFMTLLAAFNVLLYRYTSQDDILIGSPIAGRNCSEIEGLLGFFVNTLVLRTKVATNLSFRELLEQVREVALRAYAHPDLPFERLVEELQPERNLSYTPLFQVMFALQNLPVELFNTLGLKSSVLEVDNLRAKFDLTLTMQEMKQGLTGALEYNTDLFDAATITRMLRHFQTLLEDIVAHPTKRLSDLCILSEAEQYQLLSEWNDTQAEYPQDKCIHELFELQVEQTPDAVAVVFEDQQLTYRELNTHANQLAHYLQSLGVGPDVLVGVYVERSTEMVIGLLGILKSGGAYVPLDPAYPQERLAFMLEDAQIEVLLTTEKLVTKLPSKKAKTKVVDLHYDRAKITRTDNPCSNVTASNLAYVIYTSGSTGIPKGAINSHLGLCNRLLWMQETYQLASKDRILQKTPFSFDVSVWEIFWSLLNGTCLVLTRPEGHKDSGYLVKLIVAQQITTLHFVPSMLQVFLEEQELENCSCLKRVFCSGEALPFELQERFFERLGCELYNLYGPTEAAIDVTFWTCKQQSNQPIVPIGRPITNTQIYLLDAEFQLVPIGVPGELYIGGTPLARGYLNRPDLTAEKFIPNPFSQEAGSRLYKTGDLARYQIDGNIEFIRRIDQQVKIRGFRIELGEIEAVLGQHPEVQQTVVIAREDQLGDKRLVAYLVTDQKSASSISNLRHFLQQQLPEFMVPSAFVFLKELPLSPNGKVDRKALPAPELARPELQTVYVAPQNQMEQTIAAIWQESLKIETVGIDDNFFDLGGHSLLIVQVHNKLKKIFKTNFSLLKMFQYPTISSLAEYLTQVNTSKDFHEKNDDRNDKIQEGKARLKQRLKQR